ncbi:MAG: VWD domain-containing protein [Pseudomonadota bacterium]
MDPIKVEHGRIWGDPHFVGADGGKYDVQGEAGKTYNILSDKGVQMNATFKAWNNPGTTVVETVGLTVGDKQIQINKDGSMVLDGKHIAAGKEGSYLGGTVTVNHKGDITVHAGEYDITFNDFRSNAKAGAWINNIKLSSDDAVSDKVLPDGLWGTTVDGDGKARDGDRGKGTQGGGAIEDLHGNITARGDKTTVKEYEVSGLFDTTFKNFNQFDAGKADGGKGDGAGDGKGGGNVTVDADVKADVDVDVKVEGDLNIFINRGGFVAAGAPAETKAADTTAMASSEIMNKVNMLIEQLKETILKALKEFTSQIKDMMDQGMNGKAAYNSMPQPNINGGPKAPVFLDRATADPMQRAMADIRAMMSTYSETANEKGSEQRLYKGAGEVIDRLGSELTQKAAANQEAH